MPATFHSVFRPDGSRIILHIPTGAVFEVKEDNPAPSANAHASWAEAPLSPEVFSELLESVRKITESPLPLVCCPSTSFGLRLNASWPPEWGYRPTDEEDGSVSVQALLEALEAMVYRYPPEGFRVYSVYVCAHKDHDLAALPAIAEACARLESLHGLRVRCVLATGPGVSLNDAWRRAHSIGALWSATVAASNWNAIRPSLTIALRSGARTSPYGWPRVRVLLDYPEASIECMFRYLLRAGAARLCGVLPSAWLRDSSAIPVAFLIDSYSSVAKWLERDMLRRNWTSLRALLHPNDLLGRLLWRLVCRRYHFSCWSPSQRIISWAPPGVERLCNRMACGLSSRPSRADFIAGDDCDECWARLLCGGGCLASVPTAGAKGYEDPYCELTRGLCDLVLGLFPVLEQSVSSTPLIKGWRSMRSGESEPLMMCLAYGQSMSPGILPDDILVVQREPFSNLNVGDVAVVNTSGQVVAHRVVKLTNSFGVVTKGDANDHLDNAAVPEDIIGRVVGVITPRGVMNLSRSPNPWGKLCARWSMNGHRRGAALLHRVVLTWRRCRTVPLQGILCHDDEIHDDC